MSLKVLFVVYDNGSYDHVFPMGVGAIAGVLKKEGHEISVWNQDMHHWPDDYLRLHLNKNKYDVVILSLIAGYYQYQKMKTLSDAINNSENRPYYIMGGYGPTPEPEFFLKKSGCDVVCMGEGENIITKLMNAIENKTTLTEVPGIAWLDENGKLKQNPRPPLVHDLDALPPTPYELFPMHYYRMLQTPRAAATDFAFPVMSARGCSFKCTFCYRMDPGYRKRDPKALLDEVEMLYKDYGINRICFMDDLMMSSVVHTEEVCKEFLKRKLPVVWDCNGRLNYCSKELLQLMKDAGCIFVNYGIESMDQQVLNNMKKGLRPEMIYKGVEDTLEVGMSPGLNFIFGNKGDNKETMKKNVDFLLKYDDFAQKRSIRPVTPYPGSPLYYDAIEMGFLDKNNPAEDFYERKHLNSDLICVNFTELSDEEYYETLKWANETLMTNYFDKQKSQTIKQIRNLYDNRDATFRGFRHNYGAGPTGKTHNSTDAANPNATDAATPSDILLIKKDKKSNGKKLRNWENSFSGDGDRFSEDASDNKSNGNGLEKFEKYLKKKAATAELKAAAQELKKAKSLEKN